MKRPAWAAAPMFGRCWSAAESSAADGLITALYRDQVLTDLARAHVLSIDPTQAEVLPRVLPAFEHIAATAEHDQDKVMAEGDRALTVLADLLREVRTPFPVLFIDFGRPVEGYGSVPVVGSLVLEGPSPSRGAIDGQSGLAVIPFVGEQVPLPFCIYYADTSSPTWREARSSGVVTRWLDPNMDEAPVPEDAEESVIQVRAGGLGAADLTVAILSWLESVNVELIEAPLTPRRRAAALKRGRRIPQVVHVRQPKSRPRRDVSRGRANYSHRFEVRGHYMHFDESTRVGRSDPTKLSFVPGRGFVRKVWCPPHVKGPTDRPLVPKVRTVE